MNLARCLFVVGLSIAAVACSDAATEDTASANAAATTPTGLPSIGTEVSADGRSAAGALLRMSAMLIEDANLPQVAAFKDWVLTQPSGTYVQDNGAAGRTYYFDGDVIVEGDIIDGTLQLVIEETWPNPEWGPSYSAKLSTAARPATAKQLTGVDARLVAPIVGLAAKAIYDAANPNLAELAKFAAYDVSLDKATVTELPNGDANYSLEGTLLEGGDIIIGSATMTMTEKHDHEMPELNIVDYTATATRSVF